MTKNKNISTEYENSNKELFSEKEVAEYLNVSPRLLQEMRRKEKHLPHDQKGLPYYKISSCVRYAKSDIIAFLKASRR